MKNISLQENNILLPKPKECIFKLGYSKFENIFVSDKRVKDILVYGGLKNIQFNEKSNIYFVFDKTLNEEEYILEVENDNCLIKSSSDKGFFYGSVSLKIILKQYNNYIPNMYIRDWPDLKLRGVMLDISRDKVPKLETLYKFVDVLRDIKINHLQLYIEGYSFEYKSFKNLWENIETPITIDEIKKLEIYCKNRKIELVGNQNCFGHMDIWLKEKKYEHLAENFEPIKVQGGLHTSSGTTLNPLNPESINLVEKIFDDIVPYFSSELFNVNLDEPYELGTGKSKELAKQKGVGKIYLDYCLKIYKSMKKRKKKMMMWGDIVYKNPEIAKLFPKDIIMLEWGYNSYHPFEKHADFFKESGNEFVLCPGTATWGAITGRTDNMLKNIMEACRVAVKYNALGILNTEWGNCGHMQTLPMSYPAHVLAGALSWTSINTSINDLEKYLDLNVYEDKTFKISKVILDFGRYRKYEDLERETRTMAMTSFERGINQIDIKDEFLEIWNTLDDEEKQLEKNLVLKKTIESIRQFKCEELLEYIDLLGNLIEEIDFKCEDALKIKSQYKVAKEIIAVGTLARYYLLNKKNLKKKRKKEVLTNILNKIDYLVPIYRENWLKDNKSGGLERSLNYFYKLKDEIKQELIKNNI